MTEGFVRKCWIKKKLSHKLRAVHGLACFRSRILNSCVREMKGKPEPSSSCMLAAAPAAGWRLETSAASVPEFSSCVDPRWASGIKHARNDAWFPASQAGGTWEFCVSVSYLSRAGTPRGTDGNESYGDFLWGVALSPSETAAFTCGVNEKTLRQVGKENQWWLAKVSVKQTYLYQFILLFCCRFSSWWQIFFLIVYFFIF